MSLLCALFALCGATSVAAADLPDWPDTARHALPLVRQWEGTGPTVPCAESASGVCARAYLDTIAEPDVWTICFGETNTGPGEIRTIEACEAGLRARLRSPYWSGYRSCLSAEALAAETDAALTSLTWNIGTGAICRSTALRRINAGDVAGGCQALTWWSRAGGRQIRGLVNRRADEYRLCMEGVP